MFDIKMDVEQEKKLPLNSTGKKKKTEKMDVEEEKLAKYISESEDSDKTVK